MQTASSQFAAVMKLADQPVAQRVLLSLPAFEVDGVTAIPSSYADISNCVVSIRGDYAVTTTAPEGTLFIGGTSAAQVTLVLAGLLKQAAGVSTVDSQTIFWLFNSNDPTSPLYRLVSQRTGMTVTLQEGRWVGGTTPEYITVGTLLIDTVATSNGTVTLTLIDGRTDVRGPAVLPGVITPAPYNASLTNEFAYDALLRQTRYLSRPAQRSGCILSAGMRASVWADVGQYQPQQPGANIIPVFSPGAFGTAFAYALEPSLDGGDPQWAPEPALPIGSPLFTEFWLTPNNDDFSVGHYNTTILFENSLVTYPVIEFQVTSTNIVVSVVTVSNIATHTWTTAVGFTQRYVGLQINWATGSTAVTGTIRLDGTSHTFSITAADTRTTNVIDIAQMFITGAGTLEAWQVTTEGPGAAWNDTFAPTLILDQSLNSLTALPDVSGKDIWSVLQEAVAAESGVIMIDELDVAHFVNRHSIAAKASTLTLSSRVNLTGLDFLEQRSTVATRVQATVNQLKILDPAPVWWATTTLVVPPNGVLSFIANTDSPVVAVDPVGAFLQPVGTPLAGGSWWRACPEPDGSTWAFPFDALDMAVEQLSSNSLMITMTNHTSIPAYLVNPFGWTSDFALGVPFLVVGGQSVSPVTVTPAGANTSGSIIVDSQWPPASAGGAVTNEDYGEILLPIPTNDWLQDVDSSQSLVDHYLSDFHVPRPLIRNTSMISDPRLQLLDRVTVLDPDVSLASLDALVVGTHLQLGGGSGAGQFWTRTLDLRAWYPPGAWLLGTAGASELGNGSTVLGTAYLY